MSEFAPGGPGGDAAISIALTLDQCAQTAANYGIDLSCPRCASVFYTGHDDGEHVATCASRAGQIPKISESVENGLRFLQIRRSLDPASARPREGDLASCDEVEEAYEWIGRVLSTRVARRALASRVQGGSSR